MPGHAATGDFPVSVRTVEFQCRENHVLKGATIKGRNKLSILVPIGSTFLP